MHMVCQTSRRCGGRDTGDTRTCRACMRGVCAHLPHASSHLRLLVASGGSMGPAASYSCRSSFTAAGPVMVAARRQHYIPCTGAVTANSTRTSTCITCTSVKAWSLDRCMVCRHAEQLSGLLCSWRFGVPLRTATASAMVPGNAPSSSLPKAYASSASAAVCKGDSTAAELWHRHVGGAQLGVASSLCDDVAIAHLQQVSGRCRFLQPTVHPYGL